MEYFVLKQHPKASSIPILREVFNKVDKRSICPEYADLIPNPLFFEVISDGATRYTDLIDRDLFLVSYELRTVLLMYEPNLEMKIVALSDYANRRHENYFMPVFEQVECLSDRCLFNLDKSVIKHMILRRRAIGKRAVFSVKHGIRPIVIVRLDVAESILRRNPLGVALKRVEFDPLEES